MTVYDVQSLTRQCTATGRALQVGERFWASLSERDGKFVRSDFAASAWAGPPENAIAYWMGTVPAADRPKKPIIHDELLMDCLNRLDGSFDPAQTRFRYVVALLLMRRKRLKFEDAGPDDLVLRDAKTGEKIRIHDPRLSEAEIETVQNDVMMAFGWQEPGVAQ
jgi:hypothetical protein